MVSTAGARISPAVLWSVVAACAVATLANPYGWRIYQVAWEYSSAARGADG